MKESAIIIYISNKAITTMRRDMMNMTKALVLKEVEKRGLEIFFGLKEKEGRKTYDFTSEQFLVAVANGHEIEYDLNNREFVTAIEEIKNICGLATIMESCNSNDFALYLQLPKLENGTLSLKEEKFMGYFDYKHEAENKAKEYIQLIIYV